MPKNPTLKWRKAVSYALRHSPKMRAIQERRRAIRLSKMESHQCPSCGKTFLREPRQDRPNPACSDACKYRKPGRTAKSLTRSATWKRKFEDPEFAVKHAEQVGNNAFTHWSAEYLDARGWFWQFRSTWEREFAEALDRKGLTWFYEPARILLKDGRTYAPDFWVKEWNCFVEIKGWDGRPERLAKVEAARALGHKITLLLGKEQFTKALTALETAR